jgi:hypothetical protein
VVTDTDSAKSGLEAARAFTTVPLPEPEGPDIINNEPIDIIDKSAFPKP